MISSRKKNNVESAVEKLHCEGLKNVTGVVCHVGNAEQRNELFKTAVECYGGVDILVSNAAVNPETGPVLEVIKKLLFKFRMSPFVLFCNFYSTDK